MARPDQYDPDRISALLDQALAQPAAKRQAFLRDACPDEALRAEVASLLAVHEDAKSYFDDLAMDVPLALAPLRRDTGKASAASGGNDAPAPRFAPGDCIGRYQIIGTLGQGGMGVVYKALDTRLERTVALKFLTADSVRLSSRSDRLLHEAQVASALDSPFICTIYDVGETEDGTRFIAMAYYDGETIDRRIVEGALPLDEALDIATQVAEGLAAAHAAGITHRDLKPANVMITQAGAVKLLDFGIAKLRSATGRTSTGVTPGTLAYMAPEQVRRGPVDGRTDLWALGVLLYEMLSGRRPFMGDTSATVLYAILEEEPPPLSSLAPSVPPAVAHLVDRLLQKDPVDRFADAASVQAALRARREPEATASNPSRPPPHAATRWTLRHAALGLGGALLLVLGLFLAWTASDRPHAAAGPERTVVAVLPFVIQGDSGLAYLREGMVDLLATQLDGVGELRSVDPNVLLAATDRREVHDPAQGRVLARRLGASQFILGRVLSLGMGFRLSTSLYSIEGALQARAQTTVERPSALLEGIDRLARQLVASQLDDPDDQLASLAASTTASFPALRAYLAGEQHTRGGRFTDALAAFESAVAADSTFALAWYRLARTAGWVGDSMLNMQAADQARRYSTTLPDRTASIIAAYYAFRKGDPAQAEQAYRAILSAYPDDAETWYLFGETLFHNNPHVGRSTGEAREAFTQAATYAPHDREPLVHLMDLAAREERWAALDTLTARYLQPDDDRGGPLYPAYQLLRALTLEPSGARAAAWDALIAAGPEALHTALIRIGPQLADLRVSERLADQLTAPVYPDAWRAHGLHHQAIFAASQGRWAVADSAFGQAFALAPGWTHIHRALAASAPGLPVSPRAIQAAYDGVTAWDPPSTLSDGHHAGELDMIREFLLGLLSAKMEALPKARAHAHRLQTYASPPNAALAESLEHTLRAVLAWYDQRPQDVLLHLDAAHLPLPFHQREPSPLLSQHLNRFLRAEALVALGRDREALRWYDALHDGYFHWGTPYLGRSTLQRAEVYARQGQRSQARALYRRTLALWQQADAPLAPQAAMVQQRLNALDAAPLYQE